MTKSRKLRCSRCPRLIEPEDFQGHVEEFHSSDVAAGVPVVLLPNEREMDPKPIKDLSGQLYLFEVANARTPQQD